MNTHSMEKKLNRKILLLYCDFRSYFSCYLRTQSMSDHFTKILSRMQLYDLDSEDRAENLNDDERRITNGGKNTFGTFCEQMK